MWRLTKQLNDEGNGRATTTPLEADGQLLSGKQAANIFADNYEEVSNIPITSSTNVKHEWEQKERKLQAALRQLKAKKSPGPDAITNEMLTHLGNKATCQLLEIFNHSWTHSH